MENRKEFIFPSADGRTAVHAVEWHPDRGAGRCLQIAHGVAEYALRYEPFARFLNAHGFLVVANDHLGHGESVAEGAPRLYFGEKGGWQHVVDDMHAPLPDRRSLSGAAVLYHGSLHGARSSRAPTSSAIPARSRGAILMGTGQNPDAMLVGGKGARKRTGKEGRARERERRRGKARLRRLTRPLRQPHGLRLAERERGKRGRLHRRSALRRHGEHGLFLELLDGMAFIKKPANLRHMNMATPVLFISGDRDPVGGMGKGVRARFAIASAAPVCATRS